MVMNKADLLDGDMNKAKKVCEEIFKSPDDASSSLSTAAVAVETPSSFHLVSCTSGSGLQELENALTASIKSLLEAGAGEGTLITRERHRRHVKQCVEHLDEFLSRRLPMDAAAEELRLAMMELGKVTGRVDVEELLDIIFRDFCIGK
jgi:tRNA U34 5-carboxymethylaminomethyl modifying GTPase MnmE/TrmE